VNKLLISILMLMPIMLTGCFSNDKKIVKPEVPKIPKVEVDKESNYPVKSLIKNGGVSLFQENTTYSVGDIITIILEEKTAAQKKATTATKSSNNNKVNSPTIFGLIPNITGRIPTFLGQKDAAADLSFGFGTENDWKGDGSSSQSNSLSGEISVFVVGKMLNGNLFVKGEKSLLINSGYEKIVLTGVIRPSDISSSNTIVSTKVASADIRYYGDGGVISDANEMGLVTKVFNGGLGLW